MIRRVRLWRMLACLFASILLLIVDLEMSSRAIAGQPDPLHLVVHKADLVTWGAWIGWLINEMTDRDGRPDDVRCGLIVAASILGFALGL